MLLRNNKIGTTLISRIIGNYKIKGVGNRKVETITGKEEKVEVEVMIEGHNAHIVTNRISQLMNVKRNTGILRGTSKEMINLKGRKVMTNLAISL